MRGPSVNLPCGSLFLDLLQQVQQKQTYRRDRLTGCRGGGLCLGLQHAFLPVDGVFRPRLSGLLREADPFFTRFL